MRSNASRVQTRQGLPNVPRVRPAPGSGPSQKEPTPSVAVWTGSLV